MRPGAPQEPPWTRRNYPSSRPPESHGPDHRPRHHPEAINRPPSSAIAADTSLGRQALYRALSSEGNPHIDTLFRVLDTLDLRLSITR